MRKILFALLAMTAACADNNSTPGDDSGGGGGGGGGSGSGSGSGSGGDVSTADRMQDYNDVATSLGANLAVSEIVVWNDAVNFAFGRAPEGFTVSQGPDYFLYDGTRAGLTLKYKVYCRDAADLITDCNGAENHAHIKPTYSGSITGAAATMNDVSRTAAWIVRDLQMPSIRLGGDGTNSFSAHVPTGDYSIVVNDTLDHLLYAPGTAIPDAGKVELTINVNRTRNGVQRTFDVNALVEFTADGAKLTLDTTEVFSLSLATGAVTRI